MITREKIDVCMRGCDLMSKQMVEELVAERDEALEANEHLIAKDHDPCKLLLANERLLKEAYREFIKTLPIPIEVADMEAKRIFEEGQ